MVIFHDNCLDGFGAAYAAWERFGDSEEYVPANYGEAPPDVTGKDVFILDFSYPREVLEKMNEQANSLVVIDHHKTAMADLAGLPYAIFDMEKSGCVLAWEYFHPGEEVPVELLHIQDRDLWKFEMHNTKDFCAGLRAAGMKFHTLANAIGIASVYNELVELGNALNEQFDKEVQDLASRAHSFLVKVDGVERMGLAVNATAKYSSELGNVLAKRSKVCGLVYSYDGARKEWQYSLRSTDEGIDVSVIAKRYLGGGHRNAAGFARTFLIDFNKFI